MKALETVTAGCTLRARRIIPLALTFLLPVGLVFCRPDRTPTEPEAPSVPPVALPAVAVSAADGGNGDGEPAELLESPLEAETGGPP